MKATTALLLLSSLTGISQTNKQSNPVKADITIKSENKANSVGLSGSSQTIASKKSKTNTSHSTISISNGKKTATVTLQKGIIRKETRK